MATKSIWDIKPYRDTMDALGRASRLRGRGLFSVFSAVGGSGKSFCASRFADKHPEHLLIEVPHRLEMEHAPRALLDTIAEPLHIQSAQTTSAKQVADRVADRLRRRGGMLMLDEADQLTAKLADYVRRIAMRCERPVAFIGAPSMERVLEHRPAITTRVALRWEIQPATVEDLKSMFPQTFPPEALPEIIAVTRGNLALVGMLWKQLLDVKRVVKYEGITPDVVRATADEFLLAAA